MIEDLIGQDQLPILLLVHAEAVLVYNPIGLLSFPMLHIVQYQNLYEPLLLTAHIHRTRIAGPVPMRFPNIFTAALAML